VPRFAAIDVGSNASRLLVIEATKPGAFAPVAELREPVRMGKGVFITGRLDEGSIKGCVRAMKTFAAKMKSLDVVAYRAVVTASARDAENAGELLDKVRAVGVELETIDGTEEARLVKLAVQQKIPLGNVRALLCDLGGGSLELSEVHHDEVRFSTSLEIGTVRLLESFLDDGKPVNKAQEKLLAEYLDRMLQPVASDFSKRSYDIVCGTGGNFESIAQLCPRSRRPGTPVVVGGKPAFVPAIDVRKAAALLRRMARMSAVSRRRTFGLRPDRADVIVPALHVLRAVAQIARTDVILAPSVGLREGIVSEVVERHFVASDQGKDEHTATRSAIQLGRRYHFDEAHGTQVDRLALELFDRLERLHGLGEEDRVLLRVAALTHDVGDFVHFAAHHKHTQYILEHSDLMGLSPEQRVIAGCIARYHRRAQPSARHPSYGSLSPANQTKVKKLAAILRVADALDRGHRSKVQQLDVSIGRREVVVHALGREDLALEVWTAERKAEMFAKVFQRKVRVLGTT
jgi:exopolyphosphatase/guanosine-5'-triphosphate,3'-diphosphate pyrophosphatase